MTQIEILGAIQFKTGLRAADFAVKHGINAQTLYRVVKGEMRTEAVRQVISEAIGVPVDEIWHDKQKAPSSEHNTGITVGTVASVSEDGHFSKENLGG